MMNFNTVNKANTAQSLLPSFSETTDISGKSFQSIFKTVKDNSYDNSLNITAEMIKDIVRIKKIMKQWKELYIEMTVRQAKT